MYIQCFVIYVLHGWYTFYWKAFLWNLYISIYLVFLKINELHLKYDFELLYLASIIWIHNCIMTRLTFIQREKIQTDGQNWQAFFTFNNNKDQRVLCSSRYTAYACRDFVTRIKTHRTQVDTVRRKVQQHSDKYLLAEIVKDYQVFLCAQLHCQKFGNQNPNGAVLCWNCNNGSHVQVMDSTKIWQQTYNTWW